MNEEEYKEHEDITVYVKHDLYLAVPYANSLFSDKDLGFGKGERAAIINTKYTLTNEGVQDYVDVETFPED